MSPKKDGGVDCECQRMSSAVGACWRGVRRLAWYPAGAPFFDVPRANVAFGVFRPNLYMAAAVLFFVDPVSAGKVSFYVPRGLCFQLRASMCVFARLGSMHFVLKAVNDISA